MTSTRPASTPALFLNAFLHCMAKIIPVKIYSCPEAAAFPPGFTGSTYVAEYLAKINKTDQEK